MWFLRMIAVGSTQPWAALTRERACGQEGISTRALPACTVAAVSSTASTTGLSTAVFTHSPIPMSM